MRFYHRLRWRLIVAPLLGVFVGASTMVVATYIFAFRMAPTLMREELTALIADPTRLATAEAVILSTFQRTVFVSIALAASGAVIAGVVYSFVLWRSLVVPLRQIAASSQRIASGRFAERVDDAGHLGEAIARLATNFNQMAAVLEATEKARRELIGNVTHELRTPLTSLRGYIEGLEDGLFAADQETLAIMAREIGRLSRLVDDIQALSQVEAGAVQLDVEPLDLGQLTAEVVDQFLPLAQAGGVCLKVENGASPVMALGDRDRTIQILTNLVGNALRYTPERGEIAMGTSLEADGRAAVRVRDTGIGIPEPALPFVFERFFRVDDSRARTSGGSGVGLTISRQLAWMMGGDLTAHSEGPGRGSTFSLSLPQASAEQAKSQ